jgi:hypothetical protein
MVSGSLCVGFRFQGGISDPRDSNPDMADPQSWGMASGVGISAKLRLNVQKVRDLDR